MGWVSYISYLDIRRPLVFLCGPAIGDDKDNDRRTKLRKYINSNWSKSGDKNENYISASPIIVDEFLKPDEIKNKGLDIKINVIEEIISNIAYKTYIFLDTMSTSYELGQFTNYAYSSNNVVIFVDKQYRERINNSIGDYIKESFLGKFVEYTATYDTLGHISFPVSKKNKCSISKEIIDVLNCDNPKNKDDSFLYLIRFSLDLNEVNNPGVIVYTRYKEKLVLDFSIKNLFYFVSTAYRRLKTKHPESIVEMPKSIEDKTFKNFITELKKELLTTFVCRAEVERNKSYILDPNFVLTLKVGNMNVLDLIYHMLYISFMFADYKGKQTYAVPDPFDKKVKTGVSFSSSEIHFLNTKTAHLDKVLNKCNKYINSYGIKQKTMIIKKKKRNIVTYKDNYFGNEIRYYHSEILNSFLSILPSSNHSFAYKKNRNTLMCLEQHKGNIHFFKCDIRKYFDSIRMTSFLYKAISYIDNQFSQNINRISYFSQLKNDIKKDVKTLIEPLFYKRRLPIGFVSSPKISDFYLRDLDNDMGKIPGIVYTRYADDILISSKNKELLEKAEVYLKHLLLKEHLEINKNKTRLGSLINEGDSFRFLGLNIVKRAGDVYEITISNSYLVETSKMFCECIRIGENEGKIIKTIGRINYIKSVSNKSFKKLSKMIKLKTKQSNIVIPFTFKYLLEL